MCPVPFISDITHRLLSPLVWSCCCQALIKESSTGVRDLDGYFHNNNKLMNRDMLQLVCVTIDILMVTDICEHSKFGLNKRVVIETPTLLNWIIVSIQWAWGIIDEHNTIMQILYVYTWSDCDTIPFSYFMTTCFRYEPYSLCHLMDTHNEIPGWH